MQEWAVSHYDSGHRFGAGDLCDLHRNWLGGIYDWAGEYRTVNIAKGGFMFAVANRVPTLMAALEREELKSETPCFQMTPERFALALARTHGELILIHPFRDGNGRCARLLAYLMALQAGLPSLDFSPLACRGKLAYVGAIHAPMSRAYASEKHGVIGLTETAACEYATQGIRVNAVGPGFIKTPLLDKNLNEDQLKGIAAMHPMQRLGTAQGVAELVLWLVSDKASFVTGAYYNVDGGYLAH